MISIILAVFLTYITSHGEQILFWEQGTVRLQ
jgi:hypothetical protein